MNNIAKGLLTVAVLVGAGIMAMVLLATAPSPEQVEPQQVSTAIRVQAVEKKTVKLKVRSQGTVIPRTESALIPEVSGRIEWMSPNLVPGGYFQKDEVLLRLDARDLKATVDRSKAALARTQAEAEHATYEMKRMEELVKGKLTSQSSLESAIRAQRVAEAAMHEAEIALSQASLDLVRTEVRAPYEGLVRNKNVDVGQFISRGNPVATIYAADSVEVRVPLADNQLAFLDLPLGARGELPIENQAKVILSTYYGGQYYEWIGRLVRTEAEIDTRTRMVNAVVRVVDTQGIDNGKGVEQPALPVGLFVHAEIEGRVVNDVVTLPRAVLRNQSQVLVVDDENRLRYRNVELLRFENDAVVISGGLEEGEIVNLSPIQTVIDGMRVSPINEPTTSTVSSEG